LEWEFETIPGVASEQDSCGLEGRAPNLPRGGAGFSPLQRDDACGQRSGVNAARLQKAAPT
jgi:hypothetical protein